MSHRPSAPRPTLAAVLRPPLARLAFALTLAMTLSACASSSRLATPDVRVVDPGATRETKALFYNLRAMAAAGEGVLFGHQDDLAYGVGWNGEPGRSDVKAVTGSYPALYGWDLGHIELPGAAANLDGVPFDRMRGWIQDGYRRGGVVTLSWHMNNPVSGGGTWDTTHAVTEVLPGGSHHAAYRANLDRFAAFVGSLAVTQGGRAVPVPVIFRPYHEHTGAWFWWGEKYATPDEYRALWRFTVEYLRDTKGLHNLLYAYSPNSLSEFPREHYWAYYPGDDYVDVLGFDDYYTLWGGYGDSAAATVPRFTGHLRWLVEQAEARGKIPALTETGLEGVKDPAWFTGKLLASIKADPVARRIAYALVWRNAHDKPGHFYAPPPGHPAAADFVRFREDPLILFEDELPNLYAFPRR